MGIGINSLSLVPILAVRLTVAYAIYMEFERKLRLKNIKLPFSRKILRDLIKHMFAIKIDDETIPINLSEIQQKIYDTIYS